MKIVTAGVISNESGKVLLVRRAPDQSLSGYWEFPGGKVEPNESEVECLKRELTEELSIEVEVGELVAESHYMYEHGDFLLKVFEVRIIKGEPVLTVHDQMVWVEPSQLKEYRLAPADIPIAKFLENRNWTMSTSTRNPKNMDGKI